MSSRPARTRRLAVVQLVLVAIVCACGQAGASPAAPTPTPTATPAPTPAPTPTATPAPTPTPSASPGPTASPAPSQGSSTGQAGAQDAVASCPGKVEVVRSLGTPATDASMDWAGYAVSSTSTPFTCVEATWTQPRVVCRGTGLSAVAFWVGIGGVGQTGLVQTGTQTECVQGSPAVSAWHQSLPEEPYAVSADVAVSVGDRIRARVLSLGGSSYSFSIENLTTGATFTASSTNPVVDPTTAEWITEAPTAGCPTHCTITSLPDFGTVTFSNVSTTIGGVNGPLDAAGFLHTRTTLVTSSGLTRARVSATSANGRSFEVAWVRP